MSCVFCKNDRIGLAVPIISEETVNKLIAIADAGHVCVTHDLCLCQYQAEISVLQDQLRVCVQQLEQCEVRLHSQDDQAQQLLLQYQNRLEEAEQRLHRQQEDKELQMKSIISR